MQTAVWQPRNRVSSVPWGKEDCINSDLNGPRKGNLPHVGEHFIIKRKFISQAQNPQQDVSWLTVSGGRWVSSLMTLGELPEPERDKDTEVSCIWLNEKQEGPSKKEASKHHVKMPYHFLARVRPTRTRTSNGGTPWDRPQTKRRVWAFTFYSGTGKGCFGHRSLKGALELEEEIRYDSLSWLPRTHTVNHYARWSLGRIKRPRCCQIKMWVQLTILFSSEAKIAHGKLFLCFMNVTRGISVFFILVYLGCCLVCSLSDFLD